MSTQRNYNSQQKGGNVVIDDGLGTERILRIDSQTTSSRLLLSTNSRARGCSLASSRRRRHKAIIRKLLTRKGRRCT